ncbi:hypothetical protein ABTJ80_21480, partial [Acinetobacter baumannii]
RQRADRTAIATGLAGRRIHPLPAEPQRHRPPAIGQEQQGHRLSRYMALEVMPGRHAPTGRPDVAAAAGTGAL